MLLLTGTSDAVSIVTSAVSGSVQLEVQASWLVNTSAVISGGAFRASITTVTSTIVVAAPSSGVQYNVKELSVLNDHASAACTVEILHTNGTTPITLWKGQLLAGETLVLDGWGDWVRCDSNGAQLQLQSQAGGPVDVQVFPTSGTWTKPTWFTPKIVTVRAWGGGGGGGGGSSNATAGISNGGPGGGGGAYVESALLAVDVSSTETVTIGAGGGAGAGVHNAVGTTGTVGGNTTFGTKLTAYGGGSGPTLLNSVPVQGGGSAGVGSAGATSSVTSGLPLPTSINAFAGQGAQGYSASVAGTSERGGGGGGGLSVGRIANAGGFSAQGGGGGGAGGIDTTSQPSSGGNSGNAIGGTGGANGTGGSAGTNGSAGTRTFAGGSGGGGGGAAATNGTPGNGGAGGIAGGGGGGGGGSQTTTISGGNGGSGGAGYVIVISM